MEGALFNVNVSMSLDGYYRMCESTSLVKKSAPIVALYWFENFLLTYWFINDVLPTPESPNIITLSKTFFLDAIFVELSSVYEFKLVIQ